MHRSQGFTLVEVVVALALAGLVVLAAHRIFTGVVDGVERLGAARATLDREGNARALLSALAASIDVDRQNAFEGKPHRVSFTTFHLDSLGHTIRRRVVIRLEGQVVRLQGLYQTPVVLMDSVRALAFDYLLDLGADQRFVREWHSDASAPTALRLHVGRFVATDTLLLLVGWRG
jgi:prepilin-type N-terminal cleavage/methylation domain-containing protein